MPCLLGRQSHDQLLPTTYRPLPAQAGLHLAVSGPSDPADPDLAAALRQHGLLVSSLRRTYAFSPPSAGLLLGFTGLPAPLVVPAVRALSSALAVVAR